MGINSAVSIIRNRHTLSRNPGPDWKSLRLGHLLPAGQSPQQRYRRAGLGCGVAWSEAVFAEAAVELGKLAMLEQVEEGCGSPVFLTLALLQPFLIGVGQRTIRAAQTEKMDVHLRWRPLAAGREVADGAGWKQRRKRSVQAHGFAPGIGAGAQRHRRRIEPLQQADGLLEIESVWPLEQPRC